MSFLGSQRRRQLASARHGLTLIEILVSTALSTIIILAVVQLFDHLGSTVADARAKQDLAQQLRTVTELLQRDLDGLTVPARPLAEVNNGSGYLELDEGPGRDFDPDGNWNRAWTDNDNDGTDDLMGILPPPLDPNNNQPTGFPVNTILGDGDDYMAFTSRSDEPFRGRLNGIIVESNEAEIIWWTSVQDINKDGVLDGEDRFAIFRRVLLIRPDLPIPQTSDDNTFYLNNDVSARVQDGRRVANTLADLVKRENRFMHAPQFPHRSLIAGHFTRTIAPAVPRNSVPRPFAMTRFYTADASVDFNLAYNTSKFIVAANALAFDLQVYDPHAPIKVYNNNALTPNDPYFYHPSMSTIPAIASGAYVDLGYLGIPFTETNPFASRGLPVLTRAPDTGEPVDFNDLTRPYLYNIWDSWSLHYEHDNINQDIAYDGGAGGLGPDQGTNNIDDPVVWDNPATKQFGVDDVGERETQPPYPVPLRGIKITVRLYDPGTRQIRQESVITDFIPE